MKLEEMVEEAPSPASSEGPSDAEMHARALSRALERGNPKGIVSAFKAMMESCGKDGEEEEPDGDEGGSADVAVLTPPKR